MIVSFLAGCVPSSYGASVRLEPMEVSPHVLRTSYACILRQAGVSTEIQAEMPCHSIETAIRNGKTKTRGKERAAEVLEEMAAA